MKNISEKVLRNFNESLIDLISEYYCKEKANKSSLLDTKIVDLTKKATMDHLKFFMDIALSIHGQKLFNVKKSDGMRPPFTHEQQEWLDEIIDAWYLLWKDKITDGKPHKLGYAKEELKSRLCPLLK